jgi:hypothetical protein
MFDLMAAAAGAGQSEFGDSAFGVRTEKPFRLQYPVPVEIVQILQNQFLAQPDLVLLIGCLFAKLQHRLHEKDLLQRCASEFLALVFQSMEAIS